MWEVWRRSSSLWPCRSGRKAGQQRISGVVYDQDKAVLPGATVTATNEATGIAREAVTGSEGRFIITTLIPGTYSISIVMPGFQNQMREGLGLRIGQELAVDFSLSLAGVAENVTVTGEAPLVEATASRIGANVSEQEIDQLPSQGRNHLSLMQLVPGLVPELTPGEFEGGNFNANGRDVSSNLWSVDGAANQDTDGGGTGPQARITLDSMAEFQVLTHNYTAEFGGSSGVIINAVTKSGSNLFSGPRLLLLRGREPARQGSVPGRGRGQSGERPRHVRLQHRRSDRPQQGVLLLQPRAQSHRERRGPLRSRDEAAPIATNYADASVIQALSTFARVDYTRGNDNFSFRYQREVAPAVGEDFECCQTLDNRQIELDSNDRMINVGWTRLIGSRATNEFRFSHVGEDRVDGNLAYMNVPADQFFSSGWISDLEYFGPDRGGRDQFDIGSLNEYSDFATGMAAAHGGADSKNYTVQNYLTYATASGKHTLKGGFNYNRVEVAPQRIGANDNGTFSFQHNLPFDPANALHLPVAVLDRAREHRGRSRVTTGTACFVQDQWRVNPKLTLNLGLRWDYQDLNSDTKDAFGPRVGFAYDLLGDGKTVVRGGFGKFYEYHVITLQEQPQPARRVRPDVHVPDRRGSFARGGRSSRRDPCLQPTVSNGRANIGPACRAVLTEFRNSLQPGAGTEFINTKPRRRRRPHDGLSLGYSLGVKREIMPNLAVGVDFVGNRGRDLTGQVDISEGPPGANGEIRRLGVDEFDPNGTSSSRPARGAPASGGCCSTRPLGPQLQLRLAGSLAREADSRTAGAAVSPTHWPSLRMSVTGSSAAGNPVLERSGSARRLRAVELRQPARVRHERQRRRHGAA